MSSAQRLKMKQMPLDDWCTREKLCLAMSVQRSGDQNWVSVGRSIKPFGEADRPVDWFSQKNCAAQYADLLEKTDAPKRKRGEKSDMDTTEDLIVRKLTLDRIEELKKLLQQHRMQYKKLKKDIEMTKNGQADNRLHELSNEIRDQKRAEEIAAQELVKHYEEREVKIAAHKLAFKTMISPIKNKRTPNQQLKILMPPSTVENNGQLPLKEPLKVEVNDGQPNSSAVTPTKVSRESSPRSINPSPTSPLLSSLLKSPTPHPPGGLGPMSPAVSSLFASISSPNNQKEIGLPVHLGPIAVKQPNVSPNAKFVSPLTSPLTSVIPSPNSSSAVMSLFSGVSASNQQNKMSPKSNQTSPSAGAPTLSKLLEMPPSVPGRLPPLPVIKNEPLEESSIDLPDEKTELKEADDLSTVIKTENPLSVKSSDEKEEWTDAVEEIEPANEEKEEPKVEVVPPTETNTDVDVVEEKTIDESETIPKTDVKTEEIVAEEDSSFIDAIDVVAEDAGSSVKCEANDEPKIAEEKVEVVEEAVVQEDLQPNITNDEEVQTTVKSESEKPKTKSKNNKPVRRGNRKRSKSRTSAILPAQDEGSLSHESAPATPDNGSETVNSSANEAFDEEQMPPSTGGKISIPSIHTSSIADSVPNSPVSHPDDSDSLKGYKAWKKSIMLVWRAAANHKYANVFLHPVTDDHAPGYSSVVLRPMELMAIKKNVENGLIKSTTEFQRDMLLIFQNAIMYNNSNQYIYKMAVDMQDEVMQQIQDFVATQLMVSTTETKVLRGRAGAFDSGKRLSTSDASDFKEEQQPKKRKSVIDEGRGKKKLS